MRLQTGGTTRWHDRWHDRGGTPAPRQNADRLVVNDGDHAYNRSVSDEEGTSSQLPHDAVVRDPKVRTRTALPAGVLALAVVVIVAGVAILPRFGGQSGPAPSTTPVQSPSALLTPSVAPSPLPSGGISKERAIELAGPHGSLTTFASAEAGRFSELNRDANIGPGAPVKPEQWVWAVTYEGDMTICAPIPAGSCLSPRPGSLAIFLDYFTGDFLMSEGLSPGP
jgi:hypothetical protein